ncbi:MULTISPECIES: hypothetical protein [Gammaproteobacteria]|uniref:hypothetical protein n=1 Tax=Gammaproteobacteria TaxID=1236 RepID=UPI0029C4C46D|nr:hypothetical protein [Vibrio cholerae]MDX5050560.1 hypothetical protein [Vibrio cholerae]
MQLAQLWGRLMEINNWLDFVLYTFMTLGGLLIAIPLGMRCLYVGLVALFKYKIVKFKKDSNVSVYANTSIELVLSGIFCIGASIWFLFFDKGGHLLHYPAEVMRFFSGT